MADPGDPTILDMEDGDKPVTIPKSGKGEGGGAVDPGVQGHQDGDARTDDEDAPDAGTIARRHARRLERTVQRLARENANLREETRRNSEVLGSIARRNLEADLRSAQGSVQAAEQELIQARDDGDRQKELEVERRLATARSRVDEYQRFVRKAEDEGDPARDREAETGEDPRMATARQLAGEWAKKRPWFSMTGQDEDSQIARAISAAIVADPTEPLEIDDPEHFKELDRRLQKRLPERYRGERRTQDEPMVDLDVPGTSGSGRRAPLGGERNDQLPATLTKQQVAFWEHMTPLRWAKKEDREQIIAMERENVASRKGRRVDPNG